MSSSIWTECAGASEIAALSVDAWRVVESQHQIATRKLVESDAEQQVLEELIETVKPPDRSGAHLHYLLFTPFRYPPLRHGSRFGTRAERGLWYGSEALTTAFAEVAYYRLLFLDGTTAELSVVATDLTAFRVTLKSGTGVDLTIGPFTAHSPRISSPVSYAASQPLGSAMRHDGVEVFRYRSARDPASGLNVAAFTPRVFGRRQPRALESWHCRTARSGVEMTRRDYFTRAAHHYDRARFLVDGRLGARPVSADPSAGERPARGGR
jgi:hypothetical protein